MKKIVPDTSVLINGILTGMIEAKTLKNAKVVIPEFVVEELRAQASRGREIGFKGLEEIKKLRSLSGKGIEMIRFGRRQTMEEIQLSKYGRIDALILDVAKEQHATIYTSDYVQAMVAQAEGVDTAYFPAEKQKRTETTLVAMLAPDIMSLHLKEGTAPLAKRGKPGNFELVKLRDEPLTAEELEKIIQEVMQSTRCEEDSFIEVGGHAASVIQMGDMRIAIARKPFSDGLEITVVRPVIKLSLEDYKLSDKLKERLARGAEGVIIAGPPGSGKSTFAAGLADFYEQQGKIVKTMESPRDLQVKPEITQYTKLKGSFEHTADMLLLVRPDYTIFDEVRKTEEFLVFADMRLAGIGMVGVVHATQPIDAVQRFIGRIELGMIPHVIDTIIFINSGKIEKVYMLSLVVRTPSGMTEADLARPLVEVRNFETNTLEYEIYSYGEQNVVIPITAAHESPLSQLAKKQILQEVRRYDRNADVDMISDEKIVVRVDNEVIPRLIGKKGATIKQLEEKLGISIEVAPKVSTLGKEVTFDTTETGAYLVFMFHAEPGTNVNFYAESEYLFSATIGKSSQIRVAKDSEMGKKILHTLVKDSLKAFV
ncbi:MAG: Flp pilus assembly complex ATPase component TadA [Candidatus Aenigmarchaeota archaeon]|nr:Flp pilus assembly complex ATPase component TadA [Candidatus Aenigmarchaeota archaeon]